MEQDEYSLTFTAIFAKATTLIDGGWRISFDLSQDQARAIPILSELREHLLQLAIVAVDGMPNEKIE